ncbi:hypothetical protein E1A91_D07G146000v1 [Gossypium mustelinum]|uniref:Uncharacterized protein n=1 Tax=Gossypium mustelinum TaxID=34275 RepID=A0A5D2U7Y5_GOSMU|nr:hypothetical protein E1A91_D07G146000v1 [Gossypium mustelinum]
MKMDRCATWVCLKGYMISFSISSFNFCLPPQQKNNSSCNLVHPHPHPHPHPPSSPCHPMLLSTCHPSLYMCPHITWLPCHPNLKATNFCTN